ncbi:MAG TPA: transposase [Patescibacteria group bacterium]
MHDKFKNKYAIKSSRLAGYNYSQDGMYFITICTRDREHFFGDIVDGKIILSEIGKIAEEYWKKIPNHFPFINLDEFVIMPNHMHGIIKINWNGINHLNVETQNFASLHVNGNKFGPQSENLASVIRGFKVGVKKFATMHNTYFSWQPRFYDHIIRNDESLNKIREYIQTNPKMWERDRNNIENIFI